MLPAKREFRSELLPVAFGLRLARMDSILEGLRGSTMQMDRLLSFVEVGVAAAVKTREWSSGLEMSIEESSTMTRCHSWAEKIPALVALVVPVRLVG